MPYKAKLDASNIKDRIAADLAADEIREEPRKSASAVIVAEQVRWYTAAAQCFARIRATSTAHEVCGAG
jgi:hypothetical protein